MREKEFWWSRVQKLNEDIIFFNCSLSMAALVQNLDFNKRKRKKEFFILNRQSNQRQRPSEFHQLHLRGDHQN